MKAAFAALCGMLLLVLTAGSALALEVRTAILRIDYPELLPISRFDLKPDDLGFAGAVLANEDNQTTGSFLGMEFAVTERATTPEDADAALDAILAEGFDLLVVMARDGDVLRLADRAGDGVLVLNATARGSALRNDACRANLLHIAPSNAMVADAAVQFAMWKKWSRMALIHGSNPEDWALGESYKRAVAKFGGRLSETLEFEDTGGSRRTDTGHVLVQRQIPLFTQKMGRHDVVLAADASNVFGLYLPFHLSDPRPVMGSAGLRPVTFHPAHEAWGATQYQRRFERLSGRYVQEADYEVWLAIRVIGEAVIRTNAADAATLRDYILSDKFELAAFKGQKVNFRDWNGQLRQPLILYDSKITVSVSPQEGYLHQTSTLDTLGYDRPESTCTAFKENG